MGAALRLVLNEGVAVELAAKLCDLKVAEVRRLVRRPVTNLEGTATIESADS